MPLGEKRGDHVWNPVTPLFTHPQKINQFVNDVVRASLIIIYILVYG